MEKRNTKKITPTGDMLDVGDRREVASVQATRVVWIGVAHRRNVA
jgi:hypothetical protein